MPSWELFEAQDAAYRSSVLGPGTARVGCEAALRFRLGPLAIVAEARRLVAAEIETTNEYAQAVQ